MELEEKRIYFVMSPHINYYHSYRGDSVGTGGFGLDLHIMENLIKTIDACEKQGLCNGKVRISWDYSDLFWSIQLQQKYQPKVLERVIQRCKEGKDEVILGTWGNSILPGLDTEEFIMQSKWLMKNQMGIGLEQLFAGRIAPYTRTQETMFTQGMIELYNQLGIKGILNYYSVIPFDTGRPFINPRLDWNQRYGLTNFQSTVSEASMLMIPMYGFGDVMDHLSIKKWFQMIRKKQKSGEIKGHALLVLNHDMDSYTWYGTHLPKILQWMPNIGGIAELIRTVDKLEYVELTNLIDIIPNLQTQGDVVLKQDVADGCFNGYYNWSQKYDNTKYWTLGQQSRWLKVATDMLSSQYDNLSNTTEIASLLRNMDDRTNSYIKNKILFASTTHFGMSMPFNHPDRQKTALKYGVSAFKAAEAAINKALENIFENFRINLEEKNLMLILPLLNRGVSEWEHKSLPNTLLCRINLPKSVEQIINLFKDIPYTLSQTSNKEFIELEAIISKKYFEPKNYYLCELSNTKEHTNPKVDNQLKASISILKNQHIILKVGENGKISSFSFKNQEFAAPNFLDSCISFGKSKKIVQYRSDIDRIEVLEDGSNNFCASIKITSIFNMIKGLKVKTEKILKVYADIPQLFVDVKMIVPEISGTKNSDSNIYSVKIEYDDRWQEIIPCEIRPGFIASGEGDENNYLRIWKHNFFGLTTNFDLDMIEVDSLNKDIDCLVSNISDGWMAISNQKQGLLVGFNSIKAANFAFSPLKIKHEGFGDLLQSGQQVRINPFGTYYGNMLHHWTKGSGFAQKMVPSYSNTFKSTAPTFSGQTVEFDLMIAPYLGDAPNTNLQAVANHYSLPPLVLINNSQTKEIIHNFSHIQKSIKSIVKEYNIANIMNKNYLEWVEMVNKDIVPEEKRRDDINVKISHLIRLFFDGIRSKF